MKKHIIIYIAICISIFACACEKKCYKIEDMNSEKSFIVEMEGALVFQKQDCTGKPCRTEFVLTNNMERREFIGNINVSNVKCDTASK